MNAAPKRIEIKELPEGWIEINLNAAVESMKNGLYKPANEYAEHGIACLRMYNIDGGRIIWKNIKRMLLTSEEVNEYQLTPDDLLVNRVNSRELVGKTAVFPKGLEPCVYESKNIRVRLLSELVNSDFVNYQLLLFGQHHFNYNSQQVVGMASISQPQIGDFPLLLPPRFEQDRIVSKVQAMLAKLAKSSSHIANVAKTLKRFRQAVLAAACSGRLTEDWRDKQRETEASELLLDSLLKQRREEWSRLQLLRLRARGKKVKPETLNDKYVEPQPLPHPPEAELPEGWIWVSLEQLAFVMSGNTPTGIESRLEPSGDVPWFKVGDMNESGNERYMAKCTSFLNEKDVASLGLGAFPRGTVIFPKRGGAIATNKKRELVRDSCVDLNTMALIPLEAIGPYLWWWFSSIDLGSLSDGSNVPQINHSDINPLSVPLPPIKEQLAKSSAV